MHQGGRPHKSDDRDSPALHHQERIPTSPRQVFGALAGSKFARPSSDSVFHCDSGADPGA
jgi:hypothetical protein